MSLIDAFLLDPCRTNIWVAHRTDSSAGSGTATDPFNANTAQRFDALMNALDEFTHVHLGPGIFQTHGFSDEDPTSGWQPKKGMKITGSGIDVTTIQLTGTGTTDRRYYAIGHALPAGQVDFFEISDLTIDCNLAGATYNVARGAVRVRGNHSRIRRIKAVNWGSRSASKRCFVLSLVTAQANAVFSEIVNCAMEDCIVTRPALDQTVFESVALHTGTKEAEWPSSEVVFGQGPWIRNCFVDFADANGAPDFTKAFIAISAGWCEGGVIEGNHVQNVRWGGPAQKITKTGTLICRNNYYRNVIRGPWGNYAGSNFDVERWLIEGNTIELALMTETTGLNVPIGIELLGVNSPAYSYKQVVARHNKIRYLDGQMQGAYTGWGIKIEGAQDSIVENNVIELLPVNPIKNFSCGSVKYFNNTTPGGVLIRGFNGDSNQKYNELETEAEDALLLGLLRKG
jgi:hypothetical protein